jgi:autotransporter strand-loop-strand O-heptosyltransferase
MRTVIQFPIENHIPTKTEKKKAKIQLGINVKKKHVLNVGLWTQGKNQGEGLEIAKRYPDIEFHFVGNRAGNFQSYWEPLMKDVPSNVTIWDERSDIDLFYKSTDVFIFNSTFECNPLVLREAISYGLPIIARNLDVYGDMFAPYLQSLDTDLNIIEREYNIPDDCTEEIFYKTHNELYSEILKHPVVPQEFSNNINITQHFVDAPFLEITGDSGADYKIKFFDEEKIIYENTVKSNHWVRLNRRWFTKWRTEVWENNVLIYNKMLDFTGQRVLISIESSALGDTIAWMPYVLKFQEKHSCHVIVSTFKNNLFKNVYPELEFIEPGTTVHNLIAQYRIGWFYDVNREPVRPNTIPLQQTASDILGLEYEEIKPRIDYKILKRPTSKKYVTIATNSTSGLKLWQKEDWQKVIDYIYEKGYSIINVSKERNEFNHCTQILDNSLQNTMNVIHYSELFIGLSSGISWLSWAMNKPVIMIAGFTEKGHEFGCIRPINTSVCHGCWNKPDVTFDAGNWNFCPFHEGTERQWECQKEITSEIVIAEIENLLHIK